MQQLDALKTGMVLSNMRIYAKQLRNICSCQRCEDVYMEIQAWVDDVSDVTGPTLRMMTQNPSTFYRRCNEMQTRVIEEIFAIVNLQHNALPAPIRRTYPILPSANTPPPRRVEYSPGSDLDAMEAQPVPPVNEEGPLVAIPPQKL